MVVRIWRNYNPCALFVGMENCATTMENSMVVPQKIKNRITIWSRNPTSGYISKWIENWILRRFLHPHVCCSITHSSQNVKQRKCPLMDKWKKIMWYIHIMEYYSALKRRKSCHMLHHEWSLRTLCWVK